MHSGLDKASLTIAVCVACSRSEQRCGHAILCRERTNRCRQLAQDGLNRSSIMLSNLTKQAARLGQNAAKFAQEQVASATSSSKIAQDYDIGDLTASAGSHSLWKIYRAIPKKAPSHRSTLLSRRADWPRQRHRSLALRQFGAL